MATKYDAMWESLGLDLEAHDALLSALGQAYRSIILAQRDRPKAMDYFNFVMSEVHGLRIQELLEGKKQGHKVVGSFCVFVPEEIVRAADATLVGLCTGADFAMEKVERLLPRNTCALIKSAFGFKLGKVCPFLEAADIVVGENTCDGKKKSYEVLDRLVPNLYVMDLPQTKSDEGRALLRAEFVRFKQAIEELTGNTIDAAGLRRAIQLVNAKRSAMHRLAALRNADPAPVSGLDALLMNQVYFYDEPTRFIDAVHKVCDEVE
ncbi:MAG: 2-hydroxyacyl-CoA dehydratase, partial [Candidatus Brocadiae bacterium]|nr:2-hydroxyacyl-CoA dehydratase [Candidatus Brocadiia bacterium]